MKLLALSEPHAKDGFAIGARAGRGGDDTGESSHRIGGGSSCGSGEL